MRFDSKGRTDNGKYHREYERHPKSIDRKSRNELTYDEYHEDIDNEWDETESKDIERECKKFQKWTDGTIDDSKENCDYYSIQITVYAYSWSEIGGDCHRYTWNENVQKNIHIFKG